MTGLVATDPLGADSIDASTRLRRRTAMLLSPGLLLLLVHAFIPIESFIHRGDDAYYYFQLAVNYPELGFWSFDGIHPTNGTQPLWALMLTGIAQVLSWFGVRDPDVLARTFVAFTACVHFASCILLFDLLSRKVSILTGVAAAGAFLFPMGIVWARLWGMENSLYALMLTASIWYFHLRFLPSQTPGRAVLLGVILGLTALARLNACLFAWVILLYYLTFCTRTLLAIRLRMTVLAFLAAGVLILPYFAWNFISTDHFLPISGTLKALTAEQFLQREGVDQIFSFAFLETLGRTAGARLEWFASSRIGDGFWLVGSRLAFGGDSGLDFRSAIVPAVAVCVLAPLLLGRPREWFRFLADQFARLTPFAYVAVFGLLDAAICAVRYPHQLRYAIVRWWWVENEIVLVVITSTLVAATLGYSAQRLLPERWLPRAMAALLAFYLVFHAQETVRYYWNSEYVPYDWRLSWNDESYLAALWLNEHVPEDQIVGSWNAGVLGFYSNQRVVNLDGLINSYDIVPFIVEDRIADYIKREKIAFISDLTRTISRSNIGDRLKLTQVYRHDSYFMRQPYRIYRVQR